MSPRVPRLSPRERIAQLLLERQPGQPDGGLAARRPRGLRRRLRVVRAARPYAGTPAPPARQAA